jgi:hypothetical protein
MTPDEMNEIQVYFELLKSRGLIDKLRNHLKQQCFQAIEYEDKPEEIIRLSTDVKALNRFFDYLDRLVAGDIN